MIVLILSMIFSINGFGKESDINDLIHSSISSLENSLGSKEKNILSDEKILPAGSSASDWIAMVLAFAGESNTYAEYLEELENYTIEQYKKNGCLDLYKATEYHRIALTMLALGGDPSRIDNGNETINLIADGTWNFCAGSPSEQGSNGLIYALLVLEAKEEYLTENHESFKEELIQELLNYQDSDGGFYLNKSFGADIDMTAMAIQALAPYRENSEIHLSIERAVTWIVERISTATTSEAFSQTILALCALGIDPETDERFVQNEWTLIDKLNSFRTEDGLYKHELQDDASNIVSTYQSLLALEAVDRLHTDGTWIFDFNNYEFSEQINVSSHSITGICIPVVLMLGAVAAISVLHRKQKNA